MERLTSDLERCAGELLAKVDELGGAAKAIGASFFQEEIARSAYEYQMRVERGETVIVGVNKFADENEPPVIPAPDYSTLEREQVGRLRAVRSAREATRVTSRLDVLRQVARAYASPGAVRPPLMELIVDAVRARASVGEIADALRDEWGTYHPA